MFKSKNAFWWLPFVSLLASLGTAKAGDITLAGGAGFSGVRYSQLGTTNTEPGLSLNARLAFPLNRQLKLGLDFEAHHLADDSPAVSDITPTGNVLASPVVLRTYLLLVALQIDLYQGIYLRPGVGAGRQNFATYAVSANRVTAAGTSGETGIAGGIALGFKQGLSESFGLGLEGVVRRSSGEDSSNPRTIFGIQIYGEFSLN